MATVLEPFLQGGTLGIFDGPSQVNIRNAHLVVFDVSHLEEKFMRPLAMQVVQEWSWTMCVNIICAAKTYNPLIPLKNCIITPHFAWATLEARSRLMRMALDNLISFLAGAPVNVIN